MALEEERRKLEEQQLQTKELKKQAAEKEEQKQKQLEKEIEQTQIKADHIDREFRERLSSADSIQYYSGTAGQLTEQEMLDLLITRNKLEARLRKMDKAHKALEEASLDLDPSTKIRHKRVRERVVEDLQKVEHYLQSMREIIVISSDEEEEKEIVKGEPLKGQEGQEEQPSQAQKEMEANLISVLEEADTSEKIEGQPGGLTDRQLKGALIRRQYLRNKLLQVDSALAACRAVGVDVELNHLEKSLQVKRQMTKELQFCEQMINAMKKPIEELYKSQGDEYLQLDTSGEETIQKEYVAPIGGDTLPPRKETPPRMETPPRKEASPKEKRSPRKAKTPQKYVSTEKTPEDDNVTSRKNWPPIHLSPGKTRPDSEERHVERQGVLDAVRQLTQPEHLQNVAYTQVKQRYYASENKKQSKRRLPDASSSEFLRARNLEWDYQGLKLQEYDRSYGGYDGEGSYLARGASYVRTPTRSVSSMGPPRYDPRTTDRRKRKTSPSKLRQIKIEKENSQVMNKEFSPTPKKQTQEEDLVDRLRIFPQVENLTKWDINRKRAICVDCNKKHAGPVCPCNWCGWIHPGMPCPGRPYTPTLDVPKEEIREEESKKPFSCWHCGQDDHYAWTCGNKYQRQTQTQPNMETEGLPIIHVKKSPSFNMIDQLMTKERKVPTTTGKAKVVHGHLIRPSKPQTEIQKAHPTLSYILSKGPQVKPVEMYVPKGGSTSTLVIRGTGHGSSGGTEGQPPVERGTVPTEGTETSGMGGAPGGQPPPPGPPGGGGGDDDGDDDDNGNESDDEDEDTEEVSDSNEDEEGAAPPDNGPGGGGGASPPPPPGGGAAQGQSRGP